MKRPLIAIALLVSSACDKPPTDPGPAPRPVTASTSRGAAGSRPNFILILTDDQTRADLAFMPQVQALLVRQGTSFTRFLVSSPLCCPSRASLLRGQYVHNHNVWDNGPSPGGFFGFRSEERRVGKECRL